MSQWQFEALVELYFVGFFAVQIFARRRAQPGEPLRPGALGSWSGLVLSGAFSVLFAFIFVEDHGIAQLPAVGVDYVVLVFCLGCGGGVLLQSRRDRARRSQG
jgi:hypothetical protein